MGDRTRGWIPGKFRPVAREDHSHLPGKKHDGCQYFILDLTHDPHAAVAVQAYAMAARADGYDLLADDLLRKLEEAPSKKKWKGQ